MIRTIIVKYQFEAIHHWAECPFEEVGFLRDKHRHIFYVEAEKEVFHNDRDIEIIMLKREMEKYSGSKYDYGTWSCEQIAEDLLNKFKLKSCSVLEDNENGAKIYV
jgi:hypothetical protein